MMMHEQRMRAELEIWRYKMQKRPSITDRLSKAVQGRINRIIPDKVHSAVTATIKQMVRGVLYGSQYTVPKKPEFASLFDLEEAVLRRIDFYRKTAAAEGGITGAGGILLGLADFPILLGMKLKLLFDIATYYGFDVKDYKERIYILHIFQLAFSSQQHRRKVFEQIDGWEEKSKLLPDDIHAFDWQSFQIEYRDHIDLAKIGQLLPIVGAAVGLVVNYRLVTRLGDTAMNAYRMRILD
ncbi:EcsC family protein [Chitinophaga lutea]|uniref:EcsC family protein n=2 Tax=Chitinophaga lutea TaxID=2488634 RepID=A0A3N4PIB1_9BACT|nr:EcsC family protein [Chitinophaga lutea]